MLPTIQTMLTNQCELATLALIAIFFHAYRHTIGNSPLFFMLGLYFMFAVVTDSPYMMDGKVVRGIFGGLGSGMMWLPFLLTQLIIYQLEGTISAHRFLLGLTCASLIFLVFLIITVFNGNPSHNIITSFVSFSDDLFSSSLPSGIISSVTSHLFYLFVMPTIFQSVINRHRAYGTGIFLSLCIYLAFNETVIIIYSALIQGIKSYEFLSVSSWFMRLLTVLWFSLLGHFYISINSNHQQKKRNAMEFVEHIMKFFYSSGRMLRSIEEWSERYQIVVENSEEIIIIFDRAGHVLNANRAATKLIGEMMLDDNFAISNIVYDADGTPWAWQQTFSQMIPSNDSDYYHSMQLPNMRLQLPGRAPVDLDLSLSCATLNNQEIVLMIAHDVTLQHAAAKRQMAINEQMMHSQRLESLGQLAGGVAHDFNNLIQSIQAGIDTINYKRDYSAGQKEILDNINNACHRASLLTSQLLGFARKGKYNAVVIDVKNLLNQTVQLLKPTAGSIQFKVITAPEPLLLYGDENQLGQVILNMLINSRDALEGVLRPPKISLRAESARTDMPAWEIRPKEMIDRQAENFICIRIKDNGCGIPKEIIPHVFDPFFTTKGVGKGTGMGLAMAFGCITHHHGWIHIAQDISIGSEIYIFLPKARHQNDDIMISETQA